MIEAKETLIGNIASKQTITGGLNAKEIMVYPPLENLEVTPSKEQQVFNHENSYGYDEVIVDPIPDEYIIPDGTLPITENATYDVRKFARVSTAVKPAPVLQDKSITITENGTQNIVADNGYDGLNSVEVITNIESSGGGSTKITNIAELEAAIENCANGLLSYYEECISQYPSDTNEQVTLYTPDAGFKSYLIRYRNNGYQIVWFPDTIIRFRNNTEFNPMMLQLEAMYVDYAGVKGITKMADTLFLEDNTKGYYSSITYETIQDAINAMKDNTTTYASGINKSWGMQSTGGYDSIPYTNMAYLDRDYNVIMTSRRVSSNEIIQVQ